MNKIIAIVGMSGSGKSVVTDYLEEQKGFEKVYFGGVVLDKLRENNLEITPENEKMMREKLRKDLGMAAMAITLLPKIKDISLKKDCVLDGLYSWDEYLVLEKEFGSNLKTICVCCDKDIRYDRVSKRVERPFSNSEIIRRDLSEIENLAKGGPIAYADYYILNNGTLEEYYKRIEEILNKIEIQEGE